MLALLAALAAPNIQFSLDLSTAESVMRAYNTDPGAAFETEIGTRLLLKKHGETPATLKQRLKNCREGSCTDSEQLRLAETRKHEKEILALMGEMRSGSTNFARESAQVVAANIPQVDFDFREPIYIVAGGRSDAYIEEIDGKPRVAIEVRTLVTHGPMQARAAADHELWHAVFAKYVELHWSKDHPRLMTSPDYELLFTMLNEGYGHYLSVQAFSGGPAEALRELRKRSTGFFTQGFWERFHEEFRSYQSSQDKRARIEASHTGKFWEKWGAMTGALVMATLESKLGREGLLKLIETEPFSLWLKYQELAEPKYSLPEQFVTMLRGLRKQDLGN